jgi:hypothetical protein
MGNNHSIHVSRTPFPTVRFLVRRLRFWGWGGPSSLASRRSGLAILGLAWAFRLGGSRDRGCLLSNALTNSIAFSKSSRPCHSSCSLPHPFHRTRYRRSYPPSTKTHFFRTIFSTSHSPLDSSSSSIAGLGSAVGGWEGQQRSFSRKYRIGMKNLSIKGLLLVETVGRVRR